MKKIFKFILTVFIIACIFLIIASPEIYLSTAFNGLKIWALTVVPSLLPFFFLTSMLSRLGVIETLAKLLQKPFKKLFRVDGVCSFSFLTSVFSGYPIGAKTIANLAENGYIDKYQATRASTFCSTSGPLFIIGCVGIGMFNDKRAGYLIFLVHILSAVFCGLIFRFYGKFSPSPNKKLLSINSSNPLYDSVYQSVISVSLVGGFICVFSVFAKAFELCGLLSPLTAAMSIKFGFNLSNAFSFGIIECTNGIKMLANCGLSAYSLSFACSLVSFGGVSVWAQSIIFLSKVKANIKIFCASKILQGVISFFACLLLCPVFGF